MTSATVRERIPLIERYRDRLPLEPGDPVVTLVEGSTPLVPAPRLSERIGVETLPEVRGHEPDRQLQGPRHDGRRLPGGRQGSRGDHLRVDRQHRRQLRRLRRARRHPGRGAGARGQDRARKARAGRDARRAGDLAAGQLRSGSGAGEAGGRAPADRAGRTRSTRTASRARRRRRSRSATSWARPPTRSPSRSATRATSRLGGRASSSTGRGARPCTASRPRGRPRSCWAGRWSSRRRSLRRSASVIPLAGRRRSWPSTSPAGASRPSAIARSSTLSAGWPPTRACSASPRRPPALPAC